MPPCSVYVLLAGNSLNNSRTCPAYTFFYEGSTINRTFKFSLFAIILLMPIYSAEAADIRAFYNINQLPFKQIFGLPSLDNSPLTETGKLRLNIITNISNTFDISAVTHDMIATDVETLQASLVLSYAVRNNWQLGIELPYIRHSEGFLDDFIYDWHDFFNMPQNGRMKENSDQLQIFYLPAQGDFFALSDPVSGIGDIRLNSAYSRPWNNRAFIFSTELKLPTGDFDKLTGSGGLDVSAGLTINDPYSLGKYNITLFGGLAGVFLGDIDGDMSAIQNNFAFAGRAGIGWQVSRLFQLKLQVNALTPLYDSDIRELGYPALQLIIGGSLTFADDAYLDFSIAEDINTFTAADVAFQLALVVTY